MMAQPVTAAEMKNRQLPQGAIDPNVKIPRQILEAGKRSEEIQKQITGGAAEPSVAGEIEAKQQVTPNGNDAAPQANGHDAPQPAPSKEPEQQELPLQVPAQQPPAPQEADTEETWERKFKSLNGRYEGELRRGRDAVNQLSHRLEQIEAENARLRNSAPPPQATYSDTLPLTEQEISDYGPELVDMMQRMVGHATQPLHNEIQNLRGQLGHVQQETGNSFVNRMNTTLEHSVPNWSNLNRDPRFIEWSQLPDIFSGVIRRQLMQEAWNSGDPYRVAAFFRAYLAEEAATAPQRVSDPVAPPPSRMVVSDTPVDPRLSPPTPGAPLDLAALAAPGRAHSAGTAPAERPVYTSADIRRFYDDVKLGRWRGREQQQQAIDYDIMLAQREGRVIPDARNTLPKDPYMR